MYNCYRPENFSVRVYFSDMEINEPLHFYTAYKNYTDIQVRSNVAKNKLNICIKVKINITYHLLVSKRLRLVK